MQTFEELGANYKLYISIFVSIFPIISMLAHIFTKDGRDALKDGEFIKVYFVIMPIYSYFYWLDPEKIEAFLGLTQLWQYFVYIVLCLGIIIEKRIPQ